MALAVTSKVKAHVKKARMNSAGDLVPGLDKEITRLLDRACARAKANGRKTVRAGDL